MRRIPAATVLVAVWVLLVGHPSPGGSPGDEGPRAGTDLYGDPLPTGARARLGTLRYYAGLGTSEVAFAPDGRTMTATCSFWNLPPRLWEVDTGRVARRLTELESPRWGVRTESVAFSPDGKYVAVGDSLGKVRLGLLESGRKVREFVGPRSVVRAVLFVPGGKVLAVEDGAGTLWLWEVPTGRLLRRLDRLGWYSRVAFAPDGKVLATGRDDGTVALRDVATGREVRRFGRHREVRGLFGRQSANVHCVAFAPDGKLLASSGEDGTVRLWEVATGREVRHWLTYRDPLGGIEINEVLVDQLAFSPDGRLLAAGDQDQKLCLWDVLTGQPFRRFPDAPIEGGFAFAPNGKRIATGGPYLRLWDIARSQEVRRFPRYGEVRCVAFAPDGKTVATGDDLSLLRLWDVITSREVRRLAGHQETVTAVAFAPDGESLASAGEETTVRLWDAATGREVRQLLGHQGSVYAVAFAPVGKLLATGDDLGMLRLWDAATGREVGPSPISHEDAIRGQDTIRGIAFSPDGKTLAVGTDKDVWLRDAASGRQLHRLGHPEGVQSVAFAPDGKTLAAGGIDTVLRLWDVVTGREVRRFPDHAAPGYSDVIRCVAFAPGGKVVAAGGDDALVRLWDLASGKEVGRLAGHQSGVNAIAFAPDGKTLATGSEDTSTLIWELTPAPTGSRITAPARPD